MNKIYRIAVNVLLTSIICIMSFFNTNTEFFAATAELVTLDDTTDIVITVGYDAEEPKVAFISPNGDRYENDEDFDGVNRAANIIYYYISDARDGSWQIEYEKGSNANLDVKVLPWHKSISVTSLSFVQAENEIECKYTVSYDDYFDYKLYACVLDTSGNITNKILLDYGGASSTDSEISITAYTDDLPDGEYRLMLEAIAEDDAGAEVQDSFICDTPLTVSGHNAEGADKCLSVVYNVADHIVTVNFDGSMDENLNADDFALIVTQDAATTRLSEQTFEENVFSDRVIIDDTLGNINVQVNASTPDGDKRFTTWKRSFAPNMPVTLSIDTDTKSNSQMAYITFDVGENAYLGRVILNDEVREVQLSGKGQMEVELEDMSTNEIAVQVDINGVSYEVSKRINVDTMPPLLELYGVSSNMTTSEDKIVFAGSTDKNAKLTCNGEKIKLNEDGTFSVTKEISDGENEFIFESTDNAGNGTMRKVVITKNESKVVKNNKIKTSIIRFLIALLGSTLFAIILAAVSKMRRNKSENSNIVGTFFITFNSIISLLFIGLGSWQLYTYFKIKDSLTGKKLVNLVENGTTNDILEKIDESKLYKLNSFISYGIAGVFIIVLIVGVCIIKRVRKSKKK